MRIGTLFLKWAALYLVIGIAMGLGMEIMKDHSLAGAHAHINLLGWASMAIFGILYILFPKAGESRLAVIHYWLYIISLPLFMIGLAFLLVGNTSYMFLLTIFPNVLGISVLLFFINIFMNVKPGGK